MCCASLAPVNILRVVPLIKAAVRVAPRTPFLFVEVRPPGRMRITTTLKRRSTSFAFRLLIAQQRQHAPVDISLVPRSFLSAKREAEKSNIPTVAVFLYWYHGTFFTYWSSEMLGVVAMCTRRLVWLNFRVLAHEVVPLIEVKTMQKHPVPRQYRVGHA